MNKNSITKIQRIQIIDIIRGIAVLGILVINIQDMAYPEDLVFVYQSINIEKDLNYWLGIISEVLYSGKMRGLFTVIFGVSSVLIIEKLVTVFDGLESAEIYFRRMLWLMFFGLFHSYLLLWWGEVLFKYALLGMVLFCFRRASLTVLLLATTICMVVLTVKPLIEYTEIQNLKNDYISVQDKKNSDIPLTSEDQELINRWNETLSDMKPDRETIEEEVEIKRGEYSDLFFYNSRKVLEENTTIFYKEDLWDMFLYMLVGLMLIRSQFFFETVPRKFHLVIACLGIGIGFSIHSWIVMGLSNNSFDPVLSSFYLIFFDLGRLPFVLGYISLIIFCFTTNVLKNFGDCLAAVGKMALSNYLIQSIICAVLFYGFGLALFNELNRAELASIVLSIWIVQITFSSLWLKRFNYGPFEWIWRSLTYWKVQPFLKY